jgi:transposase
MANKSVLIQNIRDWIAMDNEIRELNKELRLRKSKQKKISETLLTTMKDNQIDEFKSNVSEFGIPV